MSDTDIPRNHPDPRIREADRELTKISKAEREPNPSRSERIRLAEKHDAILAAVQQIDPGFRTAEIAEGRRVLKENIAREKKARDSA